MREGWTHKKFSEVFDLQMGKTPSRDNPQYWGGENTWVAISDLQQKYINTSKENISDKAVSDTNIKIVKNGTVVMSFKLTVGRCAIATKDLYTNEAIMAFSPIDKNALIPEYIYYFLKGYRWVGSNKAVMGLTLNKKSISSNIFSYPPLAEQERIVVELDLLSSIIEKKKAQLKELDQLAQSIFYDMFGDPITNEKGWEVKKLGECFSIGAGGTPSKKVANYWDNGEIPWIGSNMCQNCIIKETDGKCITEEGLNHSSAKMLEAGTVLVALVGATIGKVALLKTETTTNQNIAHIKVNESRDFLSEYVFYHIMNQYDEFLNIGNGDFKMANQAFIKSLSICIPPLSLQQEFADKVEAIERQKTLIQQSIDEVQTMFDYTMDKYFG